MPIAFLLSHWRMLIAAGLAAFILVQHFEIEHYKARITKIEDEQLKEVNSALATNSVTEHKWGQAMTAAVVNAETDKEKTRIKYEKQVSSRDAVIDGLRKSAYDLHAAPENTGAADLQTCRDRLASVRSAAERVIGDAAKVGEESKRCDYVARAATDCETKLQLIYDSWPK
jgi:hypothetical protein